MWVDHRVEAILLAPPLAADAAAVRSARLGQCDNGVARRLAARRLGRQVQRQSPLPVAQRRGGGESRQQRGDRRRVAAQRRHVQRRPPTVAARRPRLARLVGARHQPRAQRLVRARKPHQLPKVEVRRLPRHILADPRRCSAPLAAHRGDAAERRRFDLLEARLLHLARQAQAAVGRAEETAQGLRLGAARECDGRRCTCGLHKLGHVEVVRRLGKLKDLVQHPRRTNSMPCVLLRTIFGPGGVQRLAVAHDAAESRT